MVKLYAIRTNLFLASGVTEREALKNLVNEIYYTKAGEESYISIAKYILYMHEKSRIAVVKE